MPEGQWRACCGNCGTGYHRYRRPKRLHGWFCRTCGPVAGKLVWRHARAAGAEDEASLKRNQ